MPDLNRISNLTISGAAFADVLMVHEFMHNFGHVLKIGKRHRIAYVPSAMKFGLQSS